MVGFMWFISLFGYWNGIKILCLLLSLLHQTPQNRGKCTTPLSLHLHLSDHVDSFHRPSKHPLTLLAWKILRCLTSVGVEDCGNSTLFYSNVYMGIHIISRALCTGKVNGRCWSYYHVQHVYAAWATCITKFGELVQKKKFYVVESNVCMVYPIRCGLFIKFVFKWKKYK